MKYSCFNDLFMINISLNSTGWIKKSSNWPLLAPGPWFAHASPFPFSRNARCQAGGDILINAADVGSGFGFFKERRAGMEVVVFSIAFHYSWPAGPVAGRTLGANINSYSCKLGARHPRNPKNICSGERDRLRPPRNSSSNHSAVCCCFFFVPPFHAGKSRRRAITVVWMEKQLEEWRGERKKCYLKKQQEPRIHAPARRVSFFFNLFIYLFIFGNQNEKTGCSTLRILELRGGDCEHPSIRWQSPRESGYSNSLLKEKQVGAPTDEGP